MERGVYHAEQKAPARTINCRQAVNPASGAQKHHGNAAQSSPAAGQPLAKNQALRLG